MPDGLILRDTQLYFNLDQPKLIRFCVRSESPSSSCSQLNRGGPTIHATSTIHHFLWMPGRTDQSKGSEQTAFDPMIGSCRILVVVRIVGVCQTLSCLHDKLNHPNPCHRHQFHPLREGDTGASFQPKILKLKHTWNVWKTCAHE
jgi:hypothetical protein